MESVRKEMAESRLQPVMFPSGECSECARSGLSLKRMSFPSEVVGSLPAIPTQINAFPPFMRRDFSSNSFGESKRPRQVFRKKSYPEIMSENMTGVTPVITRFLKENRSLFPDMRQYPVPYGPVNEETRKANLKSNLIGDFSHEFRLPLIDGKHVDIATVSPKTVASLISNEETSKNILIFDCRYPYEYKGGHIIGAINTYLKDHLIDILYRDNVPSKCGKTLIFHCEFSSRRGPSMYRFLRQKDREMNDDCYPSLYYPEMYLLEGGYKAFFTSFEDMCVPKAYIEMRDKNHFDDLIYYRCTMKSLSYGHYRSLYR